MHTEFNIYKHQQTTYIIGHNIIKTYIFTKRNDAKMCSEIKFNIINSQNKKNPIFNKKL